MDAGPVFRNVVEAVMAQREELFVPRETTPCRHAPGTAGKIHFLAARVDRGEELWHDEDCAGIGD